MKTTKTLDELLDDMEEVSSTQLGRKRWHTLYEKVSEDKVTGLFYRWEYYDVHGEQSTMSDYVDTDAIECEVVEPYTETVTITKYRSVS